MKTVRHDRLRLEELENRRLLSGLWKGIDIDGDPVTIKLSGPGTLAVDAVPDGEGDWLDTVAVYNTTPASTLTISAKTAKGGDGYVDVGLIDAETEQLKAISVDGWLYGLLSGNIKKLDVLGTAPDDENLSQWTIDGNLNELKVKSHLQDVDVKISGSVNKATIGGDLANASLLIDGYLKNLTINGNTADSVVSVLGKIDTMKVFGDLNHSTVETGDVLNKLYVAGYIADSDIYADNWINRIVVDGSILNTNIETPGYINVIDTWEWIEDTDILAGPEGIGAIYAWNFSNVNIDTDGQVDYIQLDAYGRHEYWNDLVIETDAGWYWPVYDDTYVSYVYVASDYNYYYVPDYWNVYYDGTWYETYYWDTYTGVYYDYSYDYDYYTAWGGGAVYA